MMNIVALWFCLNVGYFPSGHLSVYETGMYDSLDNQMDVEMMMEIRFCDNRLFVGGTIDVYMWKNRYRYDFWPSALHSTFYAGIRLWKGHFEFRYTHTCMHPVFPWNSNHAYNPKNVWESYCDKLSISLQGELPIVKSKRGRTE